MKITYISTNCYINSDYNYTSLNISNSSNINIITTDSSGNLEINTGENLNLSYNNNNNDSQLIIDNNYFSPMSFNYGINIQDNNSSITSNNLGNLIITSKKLNLDCSNITVSNLEFITGIQIIDVSNNSSIISDNSGNIIIDCSENCIFNCNNVSVSTLIFNDGTTQSTSYKINNNFTLFSNSTIYNSSTNTTIFEIYIPSQLYGQAFSYVIYTNTSPTPMVFNSSNSYLLNTYISPPPESLLHTSNWGIASGIAINVSYTTKEDNITGDGYVFSPCSNSGFIGFSTLLTKTNNTNLYTISIIGNFSSNLILNGTIIVPFI